MKVALKAALKAALKVSLLEAAPLKASPLCSLSL
jgi:hypothetical protein